MEQRLRYIIAELEKAIEEHQAVCEINHRYDHDISASQKRIEVFQDAINVFHCMIAAFANFAPEDSNQ